MRKVRIATMSVERQVDNSEATVEETLSYIEEAGRLGADLVVTPEQFDRIGYDAERRQDVGAPVPGPFTARIGELARRYGMWVVAGVTEIDGDRRYNTAAIIDRRGEVAGKHRKTHLAPGEEETGITAGDEYRVVATDFGHLGATICMEVHYPEIWTILALQGADIICHPTMWLDYTGDALESIVNARAFDNQVYVVTSHYVQSPFLAGRSMGHARIVDPYGRTRADTSHRPGLAVADVDLDEVYETWYTGELKVRYPTLKDAFLGMRRPQTYKPLSEADVERRWKLKNPLLRGK